MTAPTSVTPLIPVTGLDVPDPIPPSRAGPRVWTTPARLKCLTALAVVLVFALGVVVSATAVDLRAGLRRIGVRAVPHSLVASDLYVQFSDLDAALAAMPATGGRRGGDGEAARREALRLFQEALTRSNDDLQRLAAVTAGDPAARREVSTVLDALGRYQALAAVPQRHREATDLMRGTLLPPAQRLVDAGDRDLERAYGERHGVMTGSAALAFALGLALLAVLIALNITLARRHRRVVNPLVALMTLSACVLALMSVKTLANQSGELLHVKQDAFGAAQAFSAVRMTERDRAAERRRTAGDSASATLRWPAPPDRARHRAALYGGVVSTATLLGDSVTIRNEALLRDAYERDPDRFFGPYDRFLATMIDVNRRDLDERLDAGRRELAPWGPAPIGAAALLAGLLIAGIRPRLAEYR